MILGTKIKNLSVLKSSPSVYILLTWDNKPTKMFVEKTNVKRQLNFEETGPCNRTVRFIFERLDT